ncbi:MAG: hypothetical protein R3B57_06405 [Phycisphaerales bacterium]
MGEKPTIRVLRHLARSGGTMIARCLASMKGVALLSEVHPRAMRVTNPVWQAQEWLALISKGERVRLERPGASFVEFVTLCEERARAKGRSLVIREWSHIDYVGVPYAVPTMRPVLHDVLAPSFEIVETASVRHPLDQWLSFNDLDVIRGNVTLEAYLRGFVAFSEEAVRVGFVRFEDLTREPDSTLRTLCERLRLDFDPSYRTKWFAFKNVTGDRPELESRGSGRRDIKPLARRHADPAIVERLRASEDYQRACALLGYEP